MKKRLLSLSLALAMAVGLLAGCGDSGKNTGTNDGSSSNSSTSTSTPSTTVKKSSWKVTCPWAPSGVAAMVSQKAASKSTEYSDAITLVAEAIKGDAATVNTWVMDTKANDPELVFVGEGLLSITSIIDPAKMKFTAEDFAYVENLYSSIFVLSASADLNIKTIADLEAHVAAGNEISVAVNGATSSEAFLAAALFGKMGAGDKLKLTPYQSAAEAAQAVAKGETQFAVSHQSQILETYQQGGVTIPCAFDEKALEHGPFAGVEGVGEKGYPYFRNRCFIMARAGTDEATVAALKELYGKILADEEVAAWLQDTMLLEVDPMSQEDVDTVARLPYSMVISDSLYGVSDCPHPRLYGSFPKIIREYVRERGVLTMEEAVKKMTLLPAKRLSLDGRGMIKEGYHADLNVFDPAKVRDYAVYENPKQLCSGFQMIMVDGTVAVSNDRILKRNCGSVIKL